MNRFYLLVFMLLLSNLFFSCEKCEIEENVVVIDTNTINTTFITIGDTNNMEITSLDSFITAYSGTNNRITLDIDHDGLNDFEILNYITQGPQMSSYIEGQLNTINPESFVLGENIIDTLFRSNIVSIDTLTNNQIIYTSSVNIRCNRLTSVDTISQIRNEFKIKPNLYRDTFLFTSTFKSGSFKFWEQTYRIQTANQTSDTLFVYISQQDRCFTLPSQIPIYIGIRIDKSPQPKYGWIKLIHDNSSIIILETAIQR